MEKSVAKRKLVNKEMIERMTVLAMLVILLIVFSVSSPYFFSFKNFMAILMTMTTIGIIAIGQSMAIMVRGFDMSVGMITALSGVLVALQVRGGVPYIPAFLLTIAFGMLAGFINGFCITKLRVNAFITTFVWSQIYRGFLYIVTGGLPIAVPNEQLKTFGILGKTSVFNAIPLMVIILIGLYLVSGFVMKYTKFGRMIYCVGGNPDAAEVSGISVKKVTTIVYMICSACAALAGIIFASRTSIGNPLIGETSTLDSIAGAVLGGISMAGGKGNIVGALLGVFLIGVIQNGLVMLNIQVYWQYVATGAIMLLAVLLQVDR